MPLSVRNSTSQSLPQRVHPEMSGSPLLNGNNNNEVKGLPEIEPNPEHLLRPRTSHHDPPPPPSPSLKTVRSSDNGCPSDDGTGEKPNRVRSRNDSIRSQGTASSAEQLNELRKSLTRERSNIAGIEELDGKIDLRQLLTLACSHPLFKYLKQQRRIERLTYSDEDKRYLYDETPSVAGCAGPELRPLRGKGLWSVRRLANLDTKGLVGGVLDAFAGLLSFFDGTEGMEDLRCQNETETRLDEADEETSNDGMKKKLRRFAVACQIRIDEHKVRLYVSTEDDAPITEEVGAYLQRIWSLLRDLSHSNLQDDFWHESGSDDDQGGSGANHNEHEIDNEADRMIPDHPSDEPSPFDSPPLVALLNYTMLNSYAHWYPRFIKHFSHVHSARRISPQLFRIFGNIPDGDGQQIQLIWGSFINQAENINAAFKVYGRDYIRNHDFRERLFETIVCLENVVQGQGTVADMLIHEDERRRKELEEKENKGRFKRLVARDKKKKEVKAAKKADPKGKGKAVVRQPREEQQQRQPQPHQDIDPEIEAIRQEPPSICRCSTMRCMKKLISPFDHIITLIDFATLSKRRTLLENDLEVIPVHVATEEEERGDDETQNNDGTKRKQNPMDTGTRKGASDRHDNSQSIRNSVTLFRPQSAPGSPQIPIDRIPPNRNALQTLMVFSFFSNVMSRYEPISARRKLAGLVAELKPPSPLPPLHIHPEVKLLYHLTTTRTPTARHIGVSSPACIPCTVLFTIWNEIHGQSFHISGVSIVNNGNDTEEPLDPEQKSLFGGKKTELGNGKYSASWTVPREWRDTELLERTQEELEVRIGEALLREVDYRRSLDGDDGWWEPEDDQPVPDLRMLIRSVQAKSKEIEIENENQHLGAGDQGLVKRRRERPSTRQTKQMNQSKLSRQERIETTQPEKSTKKPALSKKMKKAKWSFMDPTTACESQ